MRRTARLVPWYHEPKRRCEVATRSDGHQCTFSAAYTATNGGAPVPVCKPHGDVLALDGWKIRPVRAITITDLSRYSAATMSELRGKLSSA